MPQPSQILFLPGAAGRTQLWAPLAGLIARPERKRHLGWPGFGPTPPDPAVHGIDDLVSLVVAQLDQPTALIAQSMGGVIAIRAALAKPAQVTHLVLAATSGGLDLASLGAQDWRAAFVAANPSLPLWFAEDRQDLSSRLPELKMPVLLIWGDADPISPLRVGERLAGLLPCARLLRVRGGDHDLAETHAAFIAPHVAAHLAS